MHTPDGPSTVAVLARLAPALACAAITPGLRSVLVFDANGDVLDGAATVLERLLQAATGREVVRVYLGGATSEDELWTSPRLSSRHGRMLVEYRSGVLTCGAGEADQSLRLLPLVVIPDLAELSLAAVRGLVAVVGADTAHVERHGASRVWAPDACWLAACGRDVVGKVSPHLLDRFALRLDSARLRFQESRSAPSTRSAHAESAGGEQAADLLRWLAEDVAPAGLEFAALDSVVDLADRLGRQRREGGPPWPEVSEGALDRILAFLTGNSHSPRREIALARLAIAQARLHASSSVTAEHVDQAARLIGVESPRIFPTTAEEVEEAAKEPAPLARALSAGQSSTAVKTDATTMVDMVMSESDTAEPLDVALTLKAADLYPEDQAEFERVAAALKEPPSRRRSSTVPHGPIVGVQPSHTTHDLALLATVVTAAKWQGYRRRFPRPASGDGHVDTGAGHITAGSASSSGFWLWPSDLRCYRRARLPEQLLVLVVDYTCLKGWAWTTPLLPHLHWAYAERAGVCLVRVGAADARVDTRADRLVARNLLDPRLDQALDARPGRATPLAHGLFLALQTLRHGLQHGQGIVQRARLVVLTDGRGNVPLHLGPDLDVAEPVGRAGVDDALAIAAEIPSLHTVEAVVLDPGPVLHPDLVHELARALGAAVVARQEP
jgi:magnesium chelatase subunit D